MPAILIQKLGKMYRLYRQPIDKVLDAFGLNSLLFWRRGYYQEFWALRDLNLEIAHGERLGIIGRNGAGKSTLLKLIIGNLAPTEGTIEVHGSIQALMELGTGFHPEFTGRQNIYASLAYQNLSPAQIESKIAEIIDFAELGEFIDQPLKTYSAGMQARLAFATATAIEPNILVIDEVLGAGDAYFANKSLERMRQLTEQSGTTVLLVSHDLGSVQQICSRVIWIDRGRIVADGAPLDVTKAYYASILLQEERRLRSRNERIKSAPSPSTPPKELLGRLVVAGEQLPDKSHPVRRIALHDGEGFQLVIEPGTPMDNDCHQPAYLMTDPMYMCWSEPKFFLNSRMRCLENTGGRYRHAPFVFSLPADFEPKGTLTLYIEHAAQKGEDVRVEIFDGHSYRLLDVLQPSSDRWLVQAWRLSDDVGPLRSSSQSHTAHLSNQKAVVTLKQPMEVVLHQKAVDRFFSAYADLHSLIVLDKDGQPAALFSLNDPVTLEMEVTVLQLLPQASCVVSLYTLSGTVVANLHWPLQGGLTVGRHRWRLTLKKPNLRQGEYLLSCGLAREFSTTTNEAMTFYCLWSRAISFRVEEGHLGNMPLGVVYVETEPPAGNPLAAIIIADDL